DLKPQVAKRLDVELDEAVAWLRSSIARSDHLRGDVVEGNLDDVPFGEEGNAPGRDPWVLTGVLGMMEPVAEPPRPDEQRVARFDLDTFCRCDLEEEVRPDAEVVIELVDSHVARDV